jgi:MFS family permease
MNVVTSPKAGRREWIGLAVLMLPTLLISMDLTVLHLAVPLLTEDLQPSTSQLLWITDIYGFMIAGSLITMGTLGDRIGRRRLLLLCTAFYGLFGAAPLLLNDLDHIYASRLLLGVSEAGILTIVNTLIGDYWDDKGRKNWLFVGSDDGGEVNATFVSLLASCEMHGLEPWGYLRDLLCLLPGWPRGRVLELAPAYWRKTVADPDTERRLAANVFRRVTLGELEAHPVGK